ncbi:rhomboid family intramembrane serine protease [Candidatus Pacearchaeota archaeon]|nr:rhomboid family intramembrane serine protease [Candidatus Pacearchaeota archaeon]
MRKRKSFLSSLSINTIIIALTVILFIFFTILIAANQKFIDFIAIKPSNILSGNYLWTFLTSIFMHGGFFHLFANMITLIFFGGLVERILGYRRYLAFYLISGIFASVFFVFMALVFSADMNSYAVGASGAIFGLIGLLMLLTPNLPVYIMFIPIPIKIKYAAPGILILLWLISLAGNVPIGNTAHLGGLIAGLVYGIYLKTKYKNKTRYIGKYFS